MARARFLVLILFLAAASRPAPAAIGDDLPALRAAYGSAKQVGDQMLFRHDGYSIAVYFDGVRSAMEIFVIDNTLPEKDTRTDFTQKDIDAILAMEGGGMPWNAVQAHSGQPTWVSGDGKMIARFNPGEKILAVLVNSKG